MPCARRRSDGKRLYLSMCAIREPGKPLDWPSLDIALDDSFSAITLLDLDVTAEHAVGARDQQAHQRIPISELSPTMKR